MNKIKDIELRLMKDLNNWREVTKGLYRFVVCANVCYEIHINIRKFDTPLVKANASLFLVGDWIDKDGVSFFARECLLEKQSVSDCIERAIKDYEV
nr:MAG TPA: hypothetical protein [Caudoviricetes sp.]